MKINNVQELIDFVNRNDVSYFDAVRVVNTCFEIVEISFREYDPEIDSKENLIEKINNDYQTDVFIHWQD